VITSSVFNCLESFPDGGIYKSFVNPNVITDGLTNCQNDIERFIRVNTEDGEDEIKEGITYDDLVLELQEGTMSYREFISRQPDLEDEYQQWLSDNRLDDSEEASQHFFQYHDNFTMMSQSLL
jgi:hypothetical protein